MPPPMIDADTVTGVHQLLSQYGHLIDARDWDRFMELFRPDATADYTGVGASKVFRGHAEIRAYFEETSHPDAHHVTNVYVYEAERQIRAHSKWAVPFSARAQGTVGWAGGDYEDVVVRSIDGWQFAHRAATLRWPVTRPVGGEG